MAAARNRGGEVPCSRVFRQPGDGRHRGEGEHGGLQRRGQDYPRAGRRDL